ncbi:hypothetical protein [Haladaptatus cibarius]|uniref:hypothetical protein n=1 Tax=Haladaptatus cibarius TaxID=453847 RepID=UPI000678B2D0|nr:hypothetical protein [Haladaptatus cibarius]
MPSLRRRSFVLALASLTGCVTDARQNSPQDRPMEDVHYTVSTTVRPSSDSELQLSVRTLDSDITPTSPARISFRLHNAGSSPTPIESGVPAPFGVLYGYRDTERILLWTDAYERSQYVQVEDEMVVGVDEVGRQTTLEPDESLERTYSIPYGTPNLYEGRHTVNGTGGRDLSFDGINYRIVLNITRKE